MKVLKAFGASCATTAACYLIWYLIASDLLGFYPHAVIVALNVAAFGVMIEQ